MTSQKIQVSHSFLDIPQRFQVKLIRNTKPLCRVRGTLTKHLVWHRNMRERIICLKSIIFHDILNYCILSDSLITISYLILPGKEQLQIILKIQHLKGFKIKGIKWESQDRENAWFSKELACDLRKIGHGKDHTATLLPSLHLTTKDASHIMWMLEWGGVQLPTTTFSPCTSAPAQTRSFIQEAVH